LGVIHLKREEHDKCIEYSTQALQIIEYFMNDTKSFSRDNKLEVKLLLRRGKSYEMKGDYEKAKGDLDRSLSLEPQNGEARSLLKSINEKLDAILYDKYREEAKQYMQQKKFFEALEYYEKSLKITRKGSTLDNIAIYVNKIACLLQMDNLEKALHECNEAIRLIRNFRNRFD